MLKNKLPGALTASAIELIAAVNIGLLIVHIVLWFKNILPITFTEIGLSIGGSIGCFALAAIIRSLHEIIKALRDANLRQKLKQGVGA